MPYDEKFIVNQSPSQAFYYINNIELEEESLELGDWIMSYNGSVLTGIRQWKGSMIDVPAMGNSNFLTNSGYLKNGDIPTFKLMKQVSGEIISLVGDVPEWKENGIFQLSGLSEARLIPEQFSITNAYPNPFNPITSIKFGLPEEMSISVQVLNVRGQKVETLFNGIKRSGYHTFQWDANNYSSGVYFINFVAGDYVNTQKLIFLKLNLIK